MILWFSWVFTFSCTLGVEGIMMFARLKACRTPNSALAGAFPRGIIWFWFPFHLAWPNRAQTPLSIMYKKNSRMSPAGEGRALLPTEQIPEFQGTKTHVAMPQSSCAWQQNRLGMNWRTCPWLGNLLRKPHRPEVTGRTEVRGVFQAQAPK